MADSSDKEKAGREPEEDNQKLLEMLSGADFLVNAGYNAARAAIERIDPDRRSDWLGLWNTILNAVFPTLENYLIYPPFHQLDSAGNKERLISEFSVFRLARRGREGKLIVGIEPRDYSEKTVMERLDAYLERPLQHPEQWNKIIYVIVTVGLTWQVWEICAREAGRRIVFDFMSDFLSPASQKSMLTLRAIMEGHYGSRGDGEHDDDDDDEGEHWGDGDAELSDSDGQPAASGS